MKKVLHLSFSFLILWASLLHAEMRIEITKGVDSPYPIGVAPFQWEGKGMLAPENISDIIFSDLRNSGKFNPIYYTPLPRETNTAKEVHPEIWPSLGINAIVIGRISSNSDGSYKVTYQLLDISKDTSVVLRQNSYKVTKKWLRYAGHAVSNEIFEKLTGIKGAFCTRIAYVAHTKNSHFPYELRVSDYDGYNQFIVHRSTQPLMSPAWSPQGDKLAYVTFENNGHSMLVIRTLSDGIVRQITSFPNHNGAPDFSPDGRKLAFALSKTGSLNLYVMDINSGYIRQITDNCNNNTEPSWFPDNKHLAYTSDQDSRPQIYRINIYNGLSRRITRTGLQNQNADISSDGKFMVMVSSNNGKQCITKQDLLTGNVQTLSSSSSINETPSLAPNNTMVIYASSQEEGSVLNIASIDGRYKSRLSEIGIHVKFPSWSPYL